MACVAICQPAAALTELSPVAANMLAPVDRVMLSPPTPTFPVMTSCPRFAAGTLPTDTPLFMGLLVGVVILVGALTFVPALALGPIVEHLNPIAAK